MIVEVKTSNIDDKKFFKDFFKLNIYLKHLSFQKAIYLIIGENAFNGCSNLKDVILGSKVLRIANKAFKGCESLENIHVVGTTPAIVYPENFSNNNYNNTNLFVPNGTLSAYLTADCWKYFWNIQEFDATGIEEIEEDASTFEYTANGIALTNAIGKNVAVYTANGTMVANIVDYDGEEIALEKDLYIIVVNGKSTKVSVK